MFFLSLVVCFSIIYCLSDDLDADLNIGDSFTVDGIVYHVTAVGEHSEVMVFCPFNPSITEYNGVDTVNWKGITYVVTSIGEGAFENCKHLSVVTIPESVTKLGDYAFFMCTGIKELTVPISIDLTGGYVIINVWAGCHNIEKITFTPGTGIGHDYRKNSGSTFLNPMNLSAQSLKSVVFEEGIKYIGKSTLYAEHGDFPALTSIIIPNTVTTIAEFAFYSCSSLTSLTLSESLTVIDNSAFSYCKSLKEITLPSSLEYIDNNAFSYCESLTSLTLPISLNVASTVFSDLWEGCESIEKITFTPGNGVGYDYATSSGDGDNVSRTPWYINRDKLTTVIFEEGITHIGNYLLYECKNLTSIIIPNTVVSIGEFTFEDCTGLKEISLSDMLISIGEEAFKNCSSLENLTIPRNVASLGDSAFEDCTGLKELTLPICLDASSSAGSYVWDDCESIKKVTFTPGDGVGYDYGTAFAKGHNVSRTPWNISKDSLTTVIFEEGITHIGNHLLYECDKITSIVIPNTVTSIGESAFEDCTSLTDISLPDSVKDIGEDAFKDCPGYQSVRLYSSCKMYASVHYNCTQMNVGVINLGSVVYRS